MRFRNQWRIPLLLIIDGMLINLAYLFSLYYRFSYDIPKEYMEHYQMSIIYIIEIYLLCFFVLGVYRSLWSFAGSDELLLTVGACVGAGIFTYLFTQEVGLDLPDSVQVMSATLTTIFVVGFRVFFRMLRKAAGMLGAYGNQKTNRVLIVGAGAGASHLIREMRVNKDGEYEIVAIIDDDEKKFGTSLCGISIVGDRYCIPQIAQFKKVDTILLAIPSIDSKDKREILDICKKTSCRIQMVPSVYEIRGNADILHTVRDVDVVDLLGREPVQLDMEGIKDYLCGRTVMVTGGGGSIGSELCRQIARFSPKELVILDVYENNAYDIQNELGYRYPEVSLRVVIASVRDRKRIDNIIGEIRPDVIFHAAAHKHVPLMENCPSEAIKNNVFGTLHVAEAADRYGVKRFVLISTDKAVNPTNIMGASKRMCEMIVQGMDKVSGTEFVAVRFGNVLGSNGSVIPLFQKQISHGGPITLTHEDITRFFMTIPEAAQLVIQAGAYPGGGNIFVLDMGSPVKIYDLACDLIKLSGLEPNKDIRIKITGLRPGEKLYEELMMDEEGLRKTNHGKIFVGHPLDTDIHQFREKLQELRFLLDNENREEIRLKVAEIVPTYRRTTAQESTPSTNVQESASALNVTRVVFKP